MADGFDFLARMSFRLPEDVPGKPEVDRRQAFRAIPPGVRVRLTGKAEEWRVNDISASGISIDVAGDPFHTGLELELDLLIAGKLYLYKMPATVVRCLTDELACSFHSLTRGQEAKLDKLVLEMQKRFIIQRKMEREIEELRQAGGEEPPLDAGPVTSINLSR